MNASDLEKYQRILRERGDLLRFTCEEFSARYIGIYIPTDFERSMGRLGESYHNVLLNDKSTIDGIMALALPTARARIKQIEVELTTAGVEFSAT
jgi:hypothetical protein